MMTTEKKKNTFAIMMRNGGAVQRISPAEHGGGVAHLPGTTATTMTTRREQRNAGID